MNASGSEAGRVATPPVAARSVDWPSFCAQIAQSSQARRSREILQLLRRRHISRFYEPGVDRVRYNGSSGFRESDDMDCRGAVYILILGGSLCDISCAVQSKVAQRAPIPSSVTLPASRVPGSLLRVGSSKTEIQLASAEENANFP